MQAQTIYKTGNSSVVTIPSGYAEQYGYQPGIQVQFIPGYGDSLVLEKINRSKVGKSSSKVSQEFNNWLKGALKEDAKILDELA